MFFFIFTEKYSLRFKHRPSLRGLCNNRGHYARYRLKKIVIVIIAWICQNIKETELSEFSWDANKEELKIKNDAFLQWFHRNDFVAMALFQFVTIDFVFPVICLQTKLPSFLTTGYTGKYRAVVRDFQAGENAELAVWTFLQWLTGNNA